MSLRTLSRHQTIILASFLNTTANLNLYAAMQVDLMTDDDIWNELLLTTDMDSLDYDLGLGFTHSPNLDEMPEVLEIDPSLYLEEPAFEHRRHDSSIQLAIERKMAEDDLLCSERLPEQPAFASVSTQTEAFDNLVLPVEVVNPVYNSIVEEEAEGTQVNSDRLIIPRRNVYWHCPFPHRIQKVFGVMNSAMKHVVNEKHDPALFKEIHQCFLNEYGFCNATTSCPGRITKSMFQRHMKHCEHFRHANDTYFASK